MKKSGSNLIWLWIGIAVVIIAFFVLILYRTGGDLRKLPDILPAVFKGAPTNTQVAAITATPKPSGPTRTPTFLPTVLATFTSSPPAATVTPVATLPPTAGVPGEPYPDAPLCSDSGVSHDNSLFHTVWDSARGCHYDHEHGRNPFTSEVSAAFPGFNLYELLGNMGVGHRNLSSPLENTLKHGGFKWDVALAMPQPCVGFESTSTGTDAAVIQYHTFGDQEIEFEARIHTTVALVRQCKTSNPSDYGYIFVPQFADYGQRVIPYIGTIVNYPNQPVPAYDHGLGPYFFAECVDAIPPTATQCRNSLQQVLSQRLPSDNAWTSKPTGANNTGNPFGSKLFQLLFRLADGYRIFDWNDQSHPFTWLWLCSNDGGVDYDPTACRYTNSSTQVSEIQGKVPAEWDNLAGFDTNPTAGRVTAEGYVTKFGDLAPAGVCLQPNAECFPIKMVNAFTGTWGSVIVFTPGKGTNIYPVTPSRNIWFCGQVVCAENAPGAVPSGWIGPAN